MQQKYRLGIVLVLFLLTSCTPTPSPTPIAPPRAGQWEGKLSTGTGQTGSVSFTITADGKIENFYFEVPFGMDTCEIQQDEIALSRSSGMYFFEFADEDPTATFTNKISGTFDGETSVNGEYSVTYCYGNGTISVMINPLDVGKNKNPVMYEWEATFSKKTPISTSTAIAAKKTPTLEPTATKTPLPTITPLPTFVPNDSITAANVDKLQQANIISLTGSSYVGKIVFNSDGTLLVSNYGNVWNVMSGKELINLSTLSTAWSPDGTLLAYDSPENLIKIWNAKSQTEQDRGLSYEDYKQGDIRRMAWSPDGMLLAAVIQSGVRFTSFVRIWNTVTYEEITTLNDPDDIVIYDVAWSPDSKMLAFPGSDGAVRVWDMQNQKFLHLLKEEPDFIPTVVAWAPDGLFLASTHSILRSDRWTYFAAIWNVKGKLVQKFKNGAEIIWSPSGKLVAVRIHQSLEDEILIWNMKTNQKVTTLGLGTRSSPCSIVWSPDETVLASACKRDEVHLWSIDNGREFTLAAPSDVYSIAWSPDGKILASASDDVIQLWGIDQK